MKEHKLGIIMNGVTGRMGTNQHLIRSICAIRDQGGIKVSPGEVITVDPILTGRSEDKLKSLADRAGVARWTTDLNEALSDSKNSIFFDASSTLHRARFVEKAARAGKAIYCEKPTAVTTAEALRLAQVCEDAGVKNGVVQDKLWLPGIRKLRALIEAGYFGEILSVRGEFGYWVFTGHDEDQPAQRPSWNYRKEDGGGIMIDMLCHWRYLVDNVFGPIKSISCRAATHLAERVDEQGNSYRCTADDSCYATMELKNGILCQFNSSWTVRVRRDDLFVMLVDGTKGSAVVGLRECRTQSLEETPRPVWNPDVSQPIDFYAGWKPNAEEEEYENAFKVQWELFLRHVALDEPFPYDLRSGARGVELAEAGLNSCLERKWIDL
ncbi:MAG: oxidoreductase [Opitutae bacterium]|nr:oxidoreductase [Opitutae bacterium]